MSKEELLQTYFFIEDISGSENTVSITKNNASAPTLNLEYSYDTLTWNSVTMNEDTTANTFTLPATGKIYFRGVNNRWGGNDLNYNYDYNIITCSGEHNVGGNTMSLLYGSEFEGKTSFPSYGNIFPDLFRENKTLISAENLLLPSTNAIQTCYQYMFYNCTSLTKAPELPATIIGYACYRYMFYNCTSLTTPPELPGTNVNYECYYLMFYNCTSLTTTPELPATTLNIRCYSMMFYNCTSLTSCNYVIPEGTTFAYSCYGGMYGNTNLLPEYTKQIDFTDETIIQSGVCASLFHSTPITDEYLHTLLPINEETGNIYLPCTTLSYGCYSSMFVNCTLLTTAPELPATTLANSCYDNMFNGCSSLTTAPELPATTLAERCYASMFDDCKTLTTAPALPATTLAKQCYYNMFSGCSSLTTAPELPATTLTNQCYQYMFWNCSKLNYIKADFINYSNNNDEFSYWVQGVSNTGTFIMNPEATYNVDEIRGINGIPTGWNIKTDLMKTPFYIEDISGSENTVSITKNNANSPTLTIEYSTDNKTWTSKTMNSDTTANTFTVPANGKLYLRGVNNGWCDSSLEVYYNKIICSGNHNVGGNIMSLLYGNEFIGKEVFPTTNSCVLTSLFYNNKTLVNSQDLQLPAATLASYCYKNMFYGCNSLEKTPELPATTLASGCYANMFEECSNLTTAPELPATTLASSCYDNMFEGCSNLTTAPELPATTLASRCYASMFSRCRSLTTAPELPATTLTQDCYYHMFSQCTSLTTAPELPATTLAKNCYYYMFRNCSNLTTIPSILPATTLADWCYSSMFVNCISLTKAPELPATTLTPSCYQTMFYGCTSLTTAPELPATTLANYCYKEMFYGCSKLNYIKADFINYSNDNNEFTDWVNGVSSTGTFVMIPNATYNPENIRGVNGIPTNWNVHTNNYFYIEDISNTENIISITKNNASAPTLNLEYSYNKSEWISVTMNSDTTANTFTIPANGKIYFRGVNNGWSSNYNYNKITARSSHNVGGNIMSLLYGSNFGGKTSFPTTNENVFCSLFRENTRLVNSNKLQLPATTLVSSCYQTMFYNCTSLTTAPELPATTLANDCYQIMFQNCTSLTTAPELPATTLTSNCYNSMFQGCSSLTTAPELPATTLAYRCYNKMFYGCYSLTTAPALPATTTEQECYQQMFRDCTSLTTAPELPATTLVGYYCYNSMFYGCSSLTTAPELPATTLKKYCYQFMFYGCSSLTTAPELPATTLAEKCYYQMFYGCSKLNYIKADFINYSNNNNEFTNWVDGVAEEGTFKLPLEATYNPEDIRGVNGIPTGWNIEISYSHAHIYNDSQDINTLIIKNSNSDLECLVDMGTEWVSLPHNETSNIEFENVIIIKGNNTTLNGVNIKTSNPSTLNGNIMSLLYGDDYKNKIVFPENSKNTFKYLFLGYDKLVDISKLELPATELASNCYHHMFTGCKSLKSIPELPANDLTNKCYHGMFMNCDGIDKATLSAQYLAPYAYSNMFLGSDNLNEVTTEFIEFDETSLKGWLEDTAEEGTLYLSKEYPHDIEETTDMLCVPSGWDVITK